MRDYRLELLVIQPTPFCNLDCGYCYLPQRSSTRRISREVLQRTFEQVFASRYARDAFTVVWHAGEPLVLPVGFYEDAFALIGELNSSGLDVSHSFQTNGTLITPAWCDFIRRNHLRIGVSVDGPAFLHDARRKTRRGDGTHKRVMQGILYLQEHSVDFHVISVLTDAALDHPEEIFKFYIENQIRRVGFNIEEIEGVNGSSTLASDRAIERVQSFMRRFLDLVKTSSDQIMVREFHALQSLIAQGREPVERNQENTPWSILSVDWAGNVSMFSPELLGAKNELYDNFILGNVLRDDLNSIEGTPEFKRLHGDIEAGISHCRKTCDYFGVCGGGSPSNKYFENKSFHSTETMHCRLSRKAVVEVLLNDLEVSLGLR